METQSFKNKSEQKSANLRRQYLCSHEYLLHQFWKYTEQMCQISVYIFIFF